MISPRCSLSASRARRRGRSMPGSRRPTGQVGIAQLTKHGQARPGRPNAPPASRRPPDRCGCVPRRRLPAGIASPRNCGAPYVPDHVILTATHGRRRPARPRSSMESGRPVRLPRFASGWFLSRAKSRVSPFPLEAAQFAPHLASVRSGPTPASPPRRALSPQPASRPHRLVRPPPRPPRRCSASPGLSRRAGGASS